MLSIFFLDMRTKYPYKFETLKHTSQCEERAEINAVKWHENAIPAIHEVFNFSAMSFEKVKTVRLKKTMLAIAILASFFFLCAFGVSTIGSAAAYFLIRSQTAKEVLYTTTVTAGLGFSFFSLLSNLLLDLDFFTKKV